MGKLNKLPVQPPSTLLSPSPHTHTKKHLKHFCHFFTRALRAMDGPTEGPVVGPMVGPMVGPTDGRTKSLKWSLVCH